jgi:Spy/CpxP family protein refolding chaperone
MNRGTKISTMAVGLTLAGLLTVVPAAAGSPPMGHGHPGHDEGMMQLLSQLNLSEAQKTRIKDILDDEHAKIAPLADGSMKAHWAVEQAIHAPTFDENGIRAAVTQAALTEGDLAVEKGRLAARIRSVLTPDQQKQMDALHQQMHDRMKKRALQHHAGWGDDRADSPDAQ